jgi:hypothetical protein
VTTSLMVGRSKLGCGLCPALSFKDLHHPCWGGGRGAYLHVGWRPASSSGFWGWKPSSSSAEEASSNHAGEGELLLPSQGATSVLCPRFRGEDESEDLPVCFGAVGARWCGAGGQVDATVGAEVVAAGESFSADKTVNATLGPTSGSLALISGSRPPRGDANESLPAVASVLGPSLLLQRSPASHLGFCRPAGPPMWGVVRTCGSGTRVPSVMAP